MTVGPPVHGEWSRYVSTAQALLNLAPALHRLDLLLEHLLQDAEARGGVASAALRGLYVSHEEAAALLTRTPGKPLLDRPEGAPAGPLTEDGEPLMHMARQYRLSRFDTDLLLIALAPELDLRYERIYGFLQDDATRRRATVDLALNLRTASPAEKMARLVHLAPEAPLIRNEVVHLVADPNHVQPPLLAHYLIVDHQILRALLGHEGLDPHLARFCRLEPPGPDLASLPVRGALKDGLDGLCRRAFDDRRPLALHFHGPPGSGRRTAARALAGALGLTLLSADLACAAESGGELAALLRLLFREAELNKRLLYLDGVEELRADDKRGLYHALRTAIARDRGVIVMAGTSPLSAAADGPANLIEIAFGALDFDQRRCLWRQRLREFGGSLTDADLDALAGRLRLTAGEIARAVSSAFARQALRPGGDAPDPASSPGLDELFAAARSLSGRELVRLTRKIEPRQSWSDLVLPPDQLAQLSEITTQARLRPKVFGEWGFGRKLSNGKGLSALFVGPPGTGKTMAAEVIAGELRLDLYKIDLSQVISKYIGESEKNLDRVFRAAENANLVLFFDEADALFGKRSEVRDSHDRYANVEIAYLLQKMDEYEGVAILATNLRQNLDEAFLRRLQFVVEFPFPDEEHRRRIWRVTFPAETPIDPAVDFDLLAREVKLAGANLRNIAVAAAFGAAADGAPIGMRHLLQAARREYQKMGRNWAVAA